MGLVGLLGGTFDPVHLGHLKLAEDAGRELAQEELRWLPAALPPHRATPQVSAADRAAMVQGAIAGRAGWRLDSRELDKETPSYTVETLQSLRDELGVSTPLVLILGMDAFLGLPNWHRWQELPRLAHVALAKRPGDVAVAGEKLPEALRLAFAMAATPGELAAAPGGCLWRLENAPLPVSASQVRAALAAGETAADLLPPSVVDYIRAHALYR